MTNETKQTNKTAVEGLYLKLSTSSSEEMVGNINVWFEQAKEIEKQNIKDAFNQGYRDGEHDNGNTTHILGDVSVWDDSENYYNETYGGNK